MSTFTWTLPGQLAPTAPPLAEVTPEAYARMMAALLPPGKVWRLIAESFVLKLLEGCADELARLDVRAGDLLDESDPSTADELLPEYERELDLEAGVTLEERQALVVARLVARQGYRPSDFQVALAPLLGQAAEDVVVLERTNAIAASMGDVREIFRFFVYRDPVPGSVYYLDAAQDLVDNIKPSHTIAHVIESIDFLCDSPTDLCDRDLLGA